MTLLAALAGRIDRRTYGLYTGAYLVLYLIVWEVSGRVAMVALPVIWIGLIAPRRLHDLDLSGWWSLAPFVFGAALSLVHGALAHIAGETVVVVIGARLLEVAVSAGMMAALGAIPGTPGPNRFG